MSFHQISKVELQERRLKREQILRTNAEMLARERKALRWTTWSLDNLNQQGRSRKSEEYAKRLWDAASIGDVPETAWLLSQRYIQFDVNKMFEQQSALQALMSANFATPLYPDFELAQRKECLQLMVKDPRIEFDLATECCDGNNHNNLRKNAGYLLHCVVQCDVRLSRCKNQFAEIVINDGMPTELIQALRTGVLDDVDFVPLLLEKFKTHVEENDFKGFESSIFNYRYGKIVDEVMRHQNDCKPKQTKLALAMAREVVRKQILPVTEVQSVFLPFLWPGNPQAHVTAAEVIIQHIEAYEFDPDDVHAHAEVLHFRVGEDPRQNQEELLLIMREFRDHLQQRAEFDPASVDPKDLEVDVPLI